MLKKALMTAALLAVAAPAQATCIIFPCTIPPDPEITFTPEIPPQVPMGCAYRAAAAANTSGGICPAGLQPVQAGGMISCGVPVAGEICSKPPRVHKVKPSRVVCPAGQKGCYTTN